MTDSDLPAFMETFRQVVRVFPLRGGDEETQRLTSSYFKALRRFHLTDVQAGADAHIASGIHFPKPAEWIGKIPPRKRTQLRRMTDADAREYRRAELLGYEDAPCSCALCQEAGVTERPIRFVPDADDNDRDIKVEDPIGNREVTEGHWAHGAELRRWYEARADFWNLYYTLKGATTPKEKRQAKRSFEERLAALDATATRRRRTELEPVTP